MRTPRNALLILLVLGTVAIAGCGGGGEEDPASPGTTTSAGGQGCETAEQPAAGEVRLKRPEQVLQPGEPATATVATSCGEFVIELDTKDSPKTANSFAFLAEEGVYDDTWFHRIVTGAFIQGGDPLGNGTGGVGYSVEEAPPGDTAYLQGTVAMAKTATEPPGTSGSQFFVVAQADAGLPPDYAIAGEVVEGIEVVQAIAALGDPASGQTGTPTQVVTLDTVTIDAG